MKTFSSLPNETFVNDKLQKALIAEKAYFAKLRVVAPADYNYILDQKRYDESFFILPIQLFKKQPKPHLLYKIKGGFYHASGLFLDSHYNVIHRGYSPELEKCVFAGASFTKIISTVALFSNVLQQYIDNVPLKQISESTGITIPNLYKLLRLDTPSIAIIFYILKTYGSFSEYANLLKKSTRKLS